MDSVDLLQLERRARRAYERQRIVRAALAMGPIVVFIASVALLVRPGLVPVAFGVLAVLAGLAMLWYGRDPQKAVLPGFAAGLVPLVLALGASRYHYCGTSGCTTLCVEACSLGGVIAGLAIATVSGQRRLGLGFGVSASTVALLSGALGCACVGVGGLVGLGLGFVAGLVPGLLWASWAARA